MESKLKELLERLKNGNTRLKLFAALGIAGIVLILISEALPGGTAPAKSEQTSYDAYITSLEKDTQELLSSIDGAGRCRVMITLKSSHESVYAKNAEENASDGSYSHRYEYVLYDGEQGDAPVLVKQVFPKIQGIAVVCDGADNSTVKESIVRCLSALFNIPTSKISVTR